MLVACLVLGMLVCHTKAVRTRGEWLPPVTNPKPGPVALTHTSCTLRFSHGEGDIACESAEPHAHSARAGSTSPFGAYVSVAMTHLVRDSTAHTWALDVSVHNLLREPLGTRDGKRALGVYAAIPGVRVTSGHGAASVANADGDRMPSQARQPHFRWAGILAPDQESPVKTWRFNVPNTASSVTFDIVIVADFPAELHVGATPPDSEPKWLHGDVGRDDSTNLVDPHDVVSLCFTDSATAQERQLAVAFACGIIIGGAPVDGGDGCYYMKAPNDGSPNPLGAAITRLESLPQVEVAGLTAFLSPGATGAASRPVKWLATPP